VKVILFNGSPDKEGCTYTALTEVAGAIEKNGIETEMIWIGNKPVSGCIACGVCDKGNGCFLQDVNEFAKKAQNADGFIFGSPVHYAATSGAVSSFLDRLFYSGGEVFRGKPGAAVVCCRRGGSSSALDELNKYFTISQMPVISSQYWNMTHGNTPDEVRHDEEGMQTMRVLGNNMAWLLKCIEAGKKAGITLPESEEREWTNFIR
jgi:multimeric flavodoxin WrbA